MPRVRRYLLPEVIANMDIETFKKHAYATLKKLILQFAAALGLGLLCASISEWAYRYPGWQSDLVGTLFELIAGVLGLAALVSGLMIFSWCRGYKTARKDAHHLELAELQQDRSSVVGPIKWF